MEAKISHISLIAVAQKCLRPLRSQSSMQKLEATSGLLHSSLIFCCKFLCLEFVAWLHVELKQRPPPLMLLNEKCRCSWGGSTSHFTYTSINKVKRLIPKSHYCPLLSFQKELNLSKFHYQFRFRISAFFQCSVIRSKQPRCTVRLIPFRQKYTKVSLCFS